MRYKKGENDLQWNRKLESCSNLGGEKISVLILQAETCGKALVLQPKELSARIKNNSNFHESN